MVRLANIKSITMKTRTTILTIIFLTITDFAFSQISADAGSNKVVCVGIQDMDTVAIGGSPSALGGTPPYTYTWEAEYTVILGSQTIHYTASNLLNDTTLANPKIIMAETDTIEFRLTVTDSKGHTARDTTTVYYSVFGTHLGTFSFYIDQGDSVYLNGTPNVFGGIPPYEYLWRPNYGLTDSTSIAFWAKPDTSVAYYLTKTDSAGCVEVGGPVYYVYVRPLNVEEIGSQNAQVVVYPNPVTDYLNISIGGKTQTGFDFRLFSSSGRLIEEKRFQDANVSIDLANYPVGLYIYEILNSHGLSEQGRIVKK